MLDLSKLSPSGQSNSIGHDKTIGTCSAGSKSPPCRSGGRTTSASIKDNIDPEKSASTSAHEEGEAVPATNALGSSSLTGDQQETVPAPSTPPSFPEGGFQAWLTVIGGSMVLFCTFGVVQSFGVYQDYYTRVSLTENTPSEISWIGSTQVFFLFALGLPAGKLFDDGYFHHSILVGSIIFTISSFVLSLVHPHSYAHNLLLQGVGMGIGMGLMFLPAITVTSHYFRRRRSLAMGVVLAGSSLGAVLHPILLNNIFDRPNGFAWGVRFASFLDLGLLMIANMIMRTRLPSRNRSISQISVLYDNVLSDRNYLIFVAGAFLVFWGLFVPFFYLQLYAALHDITAMLVTYSISIMNVSSIAGRTMPNFLADRYGVFNVLIPSTAMSGLLIYAFLGAMNIPGVVLFGIFYGFFSGGCLSLTTPAAASFCTNPDLSDLGMRIGVLSFVIAFAVLTGNPIAGALLAPPHHTWWRPLLFSTVVIIAGMVCFIISRKELVRRRKSRYV